MKTARIIVTKKCNLSCSYCCNELDSVKDKMIRTSLSDINMNDYDVICITGGEPLLNIEKVFDVLEAAIDKKVYLYTNGYLLSEYLIERLKVHGLSGINIGIHDPKEIMKFFVKFDYHSFIRFHLQDIYKARIHRGMVERFKFWTMNDCEMPNEDLFVLA